MIGFLWRASRGYRLTPWKSPYLRWRLETYWGVPADQVGFREFFSLLWRQRQDIVRYLRWADKMKARHTSPGTS